MELRIAGDIVARLERAYAALEEFVLAELGTKRPEGVSFVQLMIIHRLSKLGETNASVLAQVCYSGTNISYNLNSLVNDGLISRVRKQADKRAVFCSLTAKGQDVASALEKIVAGIEKSAGDLFDQEAYADLVRWTQMTGNKGPQSYVPARQKIMGSGYVSA